MVHLISSVPHTQFGATGVAYGSTSCRTPAQMTASVADISLDCLCCYYATAAAATRGRNAMKKAMLGSMTDFVMQRANCACLVVKPQVGTAQLAAAVLCASAA
jgi:hypothetical protein